MKLGFHCSLITARSLGNAPFVVVPSSIHYRYTFPYIFLRLFFCKSIYLLLTYWQIRISYIRCWWFWDGNPKCKSMKNTNAKQNTKVFCLFIHTVSHVQFTPRCGIAAETVILLLIETETLLPAYVANLIHIYRTIKVPLTRKWIRNLALMFLSQNINLPFMPNFHQIFKMLRKSNCILVIYQEYTVRKRNTCMKKVYMWI